MCEAGARLQAREACAETDDCADCSVSSSQYTLESFALLICARHGARAFFALYIYVTAYGLFWQKKPTKSGLLIRGRAHGRSLAPLLDLFAHHPLELQPVHLTHLLLGTRES